ncbi:Uncharacterised protein r2_g3625 [Pycnogonum litorale]
MILNSRGISEWSVLLVKW